MASRAQSRQSIRAAPDTLEQPIPFDELLSRLAIRLINLGAEEMQAAIEEGLHLTGRFARADEVRLLAVERGALAHELAYAWVGQGERGDLACSSADFFERFPYAAQTLRAGRPMIYGGLDEIPRPAQDERRYLASIGLLAAIAQPVMVDARLVAVLFIHRFTETQWPRDLIDRLPQVASIFGNALARRQAEAQLQAQLRFETLLAELSARFVNPSPADINAEVDGALAEIGTLFEADRVFLVRFSEQQVGTEGGLTLGWVAPGVSRTDPHLEGRLFDESFPWITARLREGKLFVLPADDFPAEAVAERDYVRQAQIASSILLPLAVGGTVTGAVILDSFDRARRWDQRLAQRLRVLGEIIASALQRKHDAAALRDRDQLLRATLERAPAGVALADPSGVLVQANPAFCRMLGYAESELTGKRVSELTRAEDWHLTEQALADLISAGAPTTHKPRAYEKRYTRKDGTAVWAHVVVSDLRDATGALRYVVAVAIDVSARKAAEQDLTRALAEVSQLKERLEAENLLLREEIQLHQSHDELTGDGAAMRELKSRIERVAPTDATVLILGETGSGKELVANALHRLSTRRQRPLIKVNCAALPETLIEAELFGREKGAYTGALTRQIGRFEVADGATLFLDEIGELPLALQSKLLRVLQDGAFERLGSTRTLRVDVRLIAATNRDLERAVAEGRFREDLYYRLNVFPIRVPPLRERSEDIPALVWSLIGECCERTGRTIRSLPSRDMAQLQAYAWPGNVRELRNLIERALILTEGPALRIDAPGQEVADALGRGADDERLEAIERAHIRAVLARTGWRIRGERGAAAILGLKPTTLEYRIKKLGLKRP
jgi:PAS domain S-box-containing protein